MATHSRRHEWLTAVLLHAGSAAPLLGVVVATAASYAIVYRAAGGIGAGVVAAIHAASWFARRADTRPRDKFEKKLAAFWQSKGTFAAVTGALFAAAPLWAGLAWGEWAPAALTWGAAAGGFLAGLALIQLGKAVSDAYGNFPYH